MNKKLIRKMLTASGGPLYNGGFASLVTIPVLPDIKEIRHRLYNGINPSGYQHIPERIWDALNKKKANRSIYRDDMWATYLQIPKEKRHSGVEKLQPARYRPSIGNTNVDVYRMPLNEEDTDVLIQRAQLSGLGLGKNMVDRSLSHYFGDHTVGRGHDKKGEYISYYDKYDLNPFAGATRVKTGIKSFDKWLQRNTILPNSDLSMGIGKPFEIYDRIYLDDYYGVPEEAKGGNFLPEVIVTGKKKQGGKMNILEFLKNGSGIHIKEKNKGSFTRWCGGNVTEECIRKGKASSNPKIRKKATFADNARHFKHKKGGKAFVEGVNILDSNPNAYKYVKKKIKKNLLGGNIYSGLVSTGLNAGLDIYSAYKKKETANEYGKALDKSTEVSQLELYVKYFLEEMDKLNNETLPDGIHSSNTFKSYIAHQRANKRALADVQKLKSLNELEKTLLLSLADQQVTGSIINGVSSLGLMLLNTKFSSKGSANNGAPSTTTGNSSTIGNSIYKLDSFWEKPYLTKPFNTTLNNTSIM